MWRFEQITFFIGLLRKGLLSFFCMEWTVTVGSGFGVRVFAVCLCYSLRKEKIKRMLVFLPFSSSFVQKEEGLWTRLAAIGDKKDLMAQRERSLQNVRELSQEVLRDYY